jgi:hypothetical protein
LFQAPINQRPPQSQHDSTAFFSDVLLEQDAKKKFQNEERSRYSAGSRANYRKSVASAVFSEDWNEDSASLNDADFKDKFRMNRSSLGRIVDQIKDHRVFQTSTRRQRALVEHQLMALLCFLGTDGDGMSGQKGCSVFHVGKVTLQLYKV